MFTGIITATGRLSGRKLLGDAGKLFIQTSLVHKLKVSDSLAVNGVCLTVEAIDLHREILTFHTLGETLRKTNLGNVEEGQLVNLEHPMRLGEELGGHLVSGHVDGKAPVQRVAQVGADWELEIELPPALAAFAIPKGSIAMDGISLTIAALKEKSFVVCIIPYTWEHTNIQEAGPGKLVNLEMDMVGKYILRGIELGVIQPPPR